MHGQERMAANGSARHLESATQGTSSAARMGSSYAASATSLDIQTQPFAPTHTSPTSTCATAGDVHAPDKLRAESRRGKDIGMRFRRVRDDRSNSQSVRPTLVVSDVSMLAPSVKCVQGLGSCSAFEKGRPRVGGPAAGLMD